MYRTNLIILSLVFAVLFILICTLPLEPGKGVLPHAFIGNTADSTVVNDTGSLALCDTIGPGDTVFFIGMFDTLDTRVAGRAWDFGDGMTDTNMIVRHDYSTSGIYAAIFSIWGTDKNAVCDTVIVCVNNPPTIATLIAPSSGARIASPEVRLKWNAEDSDTFDTSLTYTVITINEAGKADTIGVRIDTTGMTLDRKFGKGETVRWIVIAYDRFGASVASDTGRFIAQPGNDATLAGITIGGENLAAVAAGGDTIYSVTVENDTRSIDVSITPTDPHAFVFVNDSVVASGTDSIRLQLPDITNIFKIKVTAADSSVSKTCVLRILRRLRNNALLSSLSITAGKLSPAFAESLLTYIDTVAKGTPSLTVTPAAQDSAAIIKVNGKTVKSGNSSESVNLKLDGSDVVSVVVIAQDGTTLMVYTIAVVASGTNTPPTPSDAEAVAQDTSSILLSWNDNASNETGFSIRRSTSRDTGFVEINRVDSNRTSFADTGLDDGIEYFYRVTAFNNEGYSLPSNRASAITKVTLDVFSAKPAAGTIQRDPDTSIFNRSDTTRIAAIPANGHLFIGWSGDATGSDNPLFAVMDSSRRIIALFSNRPPVFQPMEDRSVIEGNIVEFTVAVVDSENDPVTLAAGSLPAGAFFTAATGLLQWTTAHSQIGSHSIHFSADDGSDTATDSVSIEVTIDERIPDAPASLAATASDNSSILLTWADNSSNEAGFKITRCTEANGTYAEIATAVENCTSFIDTGLESGTEYFYTVAAYNQTGTSGNSNKASAVTKVLLALSSDPPGGGTIGANPSAALFEKGDTVLLTATPADGRYFTAWAGDASGRDNPLTVVLTANRSITANFMTNRLPVLSGLDDRSVAAGTSLEFTVSATDLDDDPVTLLSGTLPAGASFNTATGIFKWTPSRDQMGAYTVTFAATDHRITLQDSIRIEVLAAPEITGQPENRTLCTGERLTIAVAADGSAPLEYMWRNDDIAIDGAESCSLVISSAAATDAGIYECAISNGVGTTASQPCTVTVNTGPSINLQPSDLLKCAGDTAVFTISATGTPPLRYQWRKDGTNISGATGDTLKIPAIDADDTAAYSCNIKNGCGNIISRAAVLTVNTPSTPPDNITATATTICPGTQVTISINGGSTGSGAAWKWYSESCGGKPAGTGLSITVAPLTSTTYFVRAEGSCNMTDCASIAINVKTESMTPVGIIADKTTICLSDSAILSVNGGLLGTGAVWEWYAGSCTGGDYLGTGNTMKVKPVATTSYSLRARGDCNGTDWVCIEIKVSRPSAAPSSASADKSTICKGDTARISVSGGTLGTGAQWKWYSGSCEGQSIGNGITLPVAPDVSTVYNVRAEGDCNVTSCSDVSVYVDSLSVDPTGATANPPSVCANAPTTLSVVGGKLGSDAKWKWYADNCNGTAIDSGASITVSPDNEKTYYVRAEGKCNTTTCAQVSVAIKTASTAASFAFASPTTICEGDSSTLVLTGGSLGTGAQWKWYAGSCDGTPAGIGTEIKVAPGSTTSYFVQAEGDCGNTGCKYVTVTVNKRSDAPTGATANPATDLCQGGTTTLSVFPETQDALGTGAKWKWYTNSSCSGQAFDSGQTVTARIYSTTTYYVRAEGTCGNTAIQSVQAIVNRDTSVAPTGIQVSWEWPSLPCLGSMICTVQGGFLGSGANWKWYTNSACNGSPRVIGSVFRAFDNSDVIGLVYVRAEGSCDTTATQSVDIYYDDVCSW